MNIASFVAALIASNTLTVLATDPTAQFGSRTRRYMGAELLPERPVSLNDYTEEKINYRTIAASGATRYSPAVLKGGVYQGSFPVHLAHQNIGSQFTASDYDALIRVLAGAGAYSGPLLQSQPGMAAVVQLTNWVDTVINRALIELNEAYRWQAIVSGTVSIVGDNGFNDTVAYPRYSDLHAAAGGNWSDITYDPFTDIFNRVTGMSNHGVVPARIITGRKAFNIMAANPLVRSRVGKVVVSSSGQIKGTTGAATLSEINSALQQDGLPPIELYDLMYQTEDGAKFFLQRDAMVIVGATGQDEVIDLGNAQYETIENTIGYHAIGLAVGQSVPGRYINAKAIDDLPPHIRAEGAQTSLPVITAPEAFSTITGIA